MHFETSCSVASTYGINGLYRVIPVKAVEPVGG